ncbi:tyrosine-type recombinase/integrase [Roseibium sp. Sym1]|uniref:tyrosine-type recombinase/integrase n=1 Tax=Roseibium sp. Sym1 TaxID=3016006 RepID=UPI0022B2D478|nr:tyrosine-type recombinase/integrase [Roseibium sp. Sym1]
MQPGNLELVHRYQTHLVEARGLHAKTVDAYLRHVLHFADDIGNRDFNSLRPGDIIRFKNQIFDPSADDPDPEELAPRTLVQIFNSLKAFLTWLREQPGHKKLAADLPDYCSPSRHLVALARVQHPNHVPTPEELRIVLSSMPGQSFKHRRDRALIAFLFLTGMRDGAVIGLKMKHVNSNERHVFQDPRDIRTKFSKAIPTTWFPVGEDIEEIVQSWICERRESGAADQAPLFPSLRQSIERQGLVTKETSWKTADPIRKLVRHACEAAKVPPFIPHAIRKTLTTMGEELCHSMQEMKAWSQNLGHEELGTTLKNYGQVPEARQHELLENMRNRNPLPDTQRLIDKLNRMNPDQRRAFERIIDGFDPMKTSAI